MKWLKEFTGWNDLPRNTQIEMRNLIFTYLFGFFTALLMVKLFL